MNRARIIEMARQAVNEEGYAFDPELDAPEWLGRFAALVLAQAMEPAGSGAGHSASSVAEASTTQPKEPRNQCDGCARGLPVTGGLHRGEGAWDLQGCTAGRYVEHSYRQQTDREYRDEIGKSMEATLRAAAERVLGPTCDAAPGCPCFDKQGHQLTKCFMGAAGVVDRSANLQGQAVDKSANLQDSERDPDEFVRSMVNAAMKGDRNG